jgi:hypothetical protein
MSKKKPTKGKKVALLDLDNDGEDEEEDNDEAMAEKEKKALEELENILRQCQKCGPSKYCKIDKMGQHVNLTFQQRRGWSVALVCSAHLHTVPPIAQVLTSRQATETHGVTLKTPPKGDLFLGYHAAKLPVNDSASAPNTPSTIVHPYTFTMPPGGYGGWPGPWMMPPNYQHPPPTPKQQEKLHVLSSDPSNYDRSRYPSISEFLAKLDIEHPRCRLPTYADRFEGMNFYNIDALVSFTEERLTAMEFGMSLGNVRFLLKEVKDEVKRLDRKKRARRE